jgi:hypothetical protein
MLKLKMNYTIILLKNITTGLCNDTRLVVPGFQKNAIYAEIVLGHEFSCLKSRYAHLMMGCSYSVLRENNFQID